MKKLLSALAAILFSISVAPTTKAEIVLQVVETPHLNITFSNFGGQILNLSGYENLQTLMASEVNIGGLVLAPGPNKTLTYLVADANHLSFVFGQNQMLFSGVQHF